ncbi:hypothetical protein V6Z12_A03G120800 [Gossypium hirsutum]|uniref:DUF4219 domain-containing protein n=1 Tax=Gossypium hirsutum TaxID=3635 RepID=A0A1U8HNG6_GOSHI|nr:uncharacterized protein LOC107887861 [Gossypium hirsutum]
MASNSFAIPNPLVFIGENHPIWVVKMKAYLRVFDLWDVVETSRNVPPLRANPIFVEIMQHSEEVAKEYMTLSCIHSIVVDVIFTRIMTCDTAKEEWDKFKEDFQGRDKTRLHGEEFSDKRIAEKVLISVLERFE